MRRFLSVTSVAACWWLAVSLFAPPSSGQAPQPGQNAGQASGQKSTAPGPGAAKPADSNPFPEDSNSVPVLPSGRGGEVSPAPGGDETGSVPLPGDDLDPVRSPDDSGVDSVSGESSSSSSSAGLDDLLKPPPDSERQGRGGKRDSGDLTAPHQEGAKEDEDIGSYYLDQKNWKAALSRYESALVLDPENPEVYWGLAEAERHMGNYASARSHYQRLIEYDPDSRHGREARRILRQPELANAPAVSSAKP
jgi:tetratricopeptide (TPR) repeat protein